jgi:uncharacterized membrane protein
MKSRNWLRALFGYFLRGIIVIAPIGITGYLIYSFIHFLDNLIPGLHPGLSFGIVIVAVTFIGLNSSTIIFKAIIDFLDDIIEHTPGAKIIYTSMRDVFTSFSGNRKKFKHPVLVLFFKDAGIQRIGFMTNEDLSSLGMSDLVAVYFPHSYAFSGNLFLVPREHVTSLPGVSATDALKMIISGGVATFEMPEAESPKI